MAQSPHKPVTAIPGSAVNNTMSARKIKMAMASLMALGVFGAGSALAADDVDQLSTSLDEAIVMETATAGTSVPAVDYQAPASKSPNKWLIGGAMALILAALYKLVGANRMANMIADAGPTLRKAAESLAKAPAAAAKAVGEAVFSPMKFLMIVGGLAMIGFTGISIFDLQWGAGIATGIGMTAVTWFGTSKLTKAFRRQKVRVKPQNHQHPHQPPQRPHL